MHFLRIHNTYVNLELRTWSESFQQGSISAPGGDGNRCTALQISMLYVGQQLAKPSGYAGHWALQLLGRLEIKHAVVFIIFAAGVKAFRGPMECLRLFISSSKSELLGASGADVVCFRKSRGTPSPPTVFSFPARLSPSERHALPQGYSPWTMRDQIRGK